MEKYQLEFHREGNANPSSAFEGAESHGGDPAEKEPKKNKDNPKTIKEKTTTQLAKNASQSQNINPRDLLPHALNYTSATI